MATGPKCADEAQRYILQKIRDAVPDNKYSEIIDPDRTYDGEEEWSIGSVFDDGNLREFDDDEEDYEQAVEIFEELDKVYDAIKTTRSGGASYDKLKALKAFSHRYDAEIPTDNKSTRHKWVQQYGDAGLLDISSDKTGRKPQHQGVLTEHGEAFINTTEALNEQVFSNLNIDTGDFYRKMFTQGYGDREAHSGDKIQAFFLYGAGMNHSEVSQDLDVPETTVRDMANYLEDKGLFTEDNMFTPEGRGLAEFVLCQLDDAEPEEFEQGRVRTNLGQREDDFFDDDGMLDM